MALVEESDSEQARPDVVALPSHAKTVASSAVLERQYVTDSANGISAITTGVKTINGAIGVDANVKSESCAGVAKATIPTLFEDAKRRGLSAGVVTTSGITDATPAGAYGHTSTRSWRFDVDLPKAAMTAVCTDLARQLVDAPAAIRMNVALGGDRLNFLSAGGNWRAHARMGATLLKNGRRKARRPLMWRMLRTLRRWMRARPIIR